MKSPEAMSREELEGEVLYWRDEFGMIADEKALSRVQEAFDLAPTAARYLVVLRQANGRPLSRWWLDDEVPSKQGRDSNATSVYVCILRRALGYGAIETHWGRGYALTPEGIAKVDAALNPTRAAA